MDSKELTEEYVIIASIRHLVTHLETLTRDLNASPPPSGKISKQISSIEMKIRQLRQHLA
jgi:hypothetical protein